MGRTCRIFGHFQWPTAGQHRAGAGRLGHRHAVGGALAIPHIRIVPAMKNTVLVIDDQTTGRAILEQIVLSMDSNIVVESFERPIDAVVWAATHVADLVLVDYQMPEMDGIELAKRLRGLPGYEH